MTFVKILMTVNSLIKKIHDSEYDIKKLEEENEQLKKENEKYRQILLDFGVRTVFKENIVLKDGDSE